MVRGHDKLTVDEQIDRSCDLLRSAHRRRVIYALRRDGAATVDELADVLTAAGLADDRQRAVAQLVHTHLPKLADAGVVEYEGPEGAVSLGQAVEDLNPFLAVAAKRETDAERPSLSEEVAPDPVAGRRPD